MATKCPSWFLRILNDNDPLLECRWSPAFNCWAIERPHRFLASEVEMFLGRYKTEDELRRHSASEEEAKEHDTAARLAWENFESSRRQRALILLTPYLDARTFARLYATDVTRGGGFKQFHDRILREREREDEIKRRAQHWDGRERAEEAHSFIRWADKRRQTEILMGREGGEKMLKEAYGSAEHRREVFG